MLTSSIIPLPLMLHLITPRAKVASIYCRAHLPACYPPAPRGFRVLGCENGRVDLLNIDTGTHATVDRSEIYNIRAFVTWEI
jgi:hypothetical protein